MHCREPHAAARTGRRRIVLGRASVWHLAAAALATVLLTACEPTFIFAGGELAGTEESSPASWQFSRQVDTVQIETRPADPYSVNVWGVHVDANFYVAASAGADSRWARAIEGDPSVRLRIGDRLFPLVATRIADGDEKARVIDAYVEKYDVERDGNFVDSAWVYRLAPRQRQRRDG